MGVSQRHPAIRNISTGQPVSHTCIGCARWWMQSLLVWAPPLPMTRSSLCGGAGGRTPAAEGPNPVRVVVDPNGRLPANARMLVQDGARRLIITATNARKSAVNGVEIVPLPLTAGRLAPAAILAELAKPGMRRILIEGGDNTV